MSHIKHAFKNILENKLDDMRQNFSSALSERAMQKLEEKKIAVAQNYFAKPSPKKDK